jgi:hypothetical protein
MSISLGDKLLEKGLEAAFAETTWVRSRIGDGDADANAARPAIRDRRPWRGWRRGAGQRGITTRSRTWMTPFDW